MVSGYGAPLSMGECVFAVLMWDAGRPSPIHGESGSG